MPDYRKLLRKFFYDKDGKLVAWQRPNLALWVWIVAAVLSRLLPAGDLAQAISLAGRIAILIWAFMEVAWGASYFRRLLGLAVILLAVLPKLF